MKINLDDAFLNLRGEPLPVKLSDILANILALSNTGKPAKMITWAVNLTNDAEIEVDKSDLNFLSGFVENNRMSNMLKAQILERFEKADNVPALHDIFLKNVCER